MLRVAWPRADFPHQTTVTLPLADGEARQHG